MSEYKPRMEAYQANAILDKEMEWHKWMKLIPYINFPKEWEVKIVPPFANAVVRFWIRKIGKDKRGVSVYLDCYDFLGFFGEPYWEIYPYEDDIYRCAMNDVNELLEAIQHSLDKQE